MTKVFIPTKLVDEIENYILIDSELSNTTDKQKKNLTKQLISLWYYIYNEQIDSENDSLQLYINIPKEKLEVFYIKISNKKLGYRVLLEMLQKNNLIDINEIYSTGKFSKGYRIKTDFISNSNYTEIEIDFDKVFYKKQTKQFWLSKYPQFSHLIEDSYSTQIDLDDYIYWMQNNIGIELKPVIANGIIKRRFLTEERIYLHTNLALKLNFQNLWFKLSNEGRFYSTITNLPFTSLPFFKMYRRKVYDIDIKNSQPLLLSILIDNPLYKSDVEQGIFYDKVAAELGIEKKYFKMLSYKYIFFSNKPTLSGKIFNAMEKIYPSMMQSINNLKKEMNLALKLQTLESEIFINKLGKLPIKKLLRHDQVLIHKEDFELVKMFLLNEYKRIGLNINLD
jgi:hypothetical protein